MMRTACWRAVLVWAVGAAALAAQTPAPAITEERVRETVGWLAADERKGRDTGTAELAEAAHWLAARFQAAGLAQATEGTWFHEYSLPGLLLDSRAVKLTLVRKHGDDKSERTLAADTEVRQWTACDTLEGTDERCTVAPAADPVLERLLLTATSARQPIVIEVGEDHAYWKRAAGVHGVLGGRRAASRPVLLVKQGSLPASKKADDGREIVWSATWSVGAPEPGDVTERNVVGLLRGMDKKDEYVVVSAHYDHIGTGRAVGDDAIYNGADDNATGTTAVVLLAEALAKTPLRRSVLFVCFSAEERRLQGSAAFCARPPAAVPLEQVVANLNLEMLGRPEPGASGKAWITGSNLSDFAAICKPALARGGVELVEFPMASQLFAASDNYSFVRHGVVAHSLSAGSLHADYHQPGDEVGKLDVPHMTKVVQALVEVVKELASRDAPPAWNEAGRRMLARTKK